MNASVRGAEWFATPELSFRRLIEGIPAMTYVEAVVESNERDGNPAVWVSPQLAQFFGVSVEEMLSTPWWWNERIHPDDLERVLAEDERTTQNGEPYSLDYRAFRSDGLQVWIHDEAVLLRDDDGQALFWVGVIRDITDRKLAEEEVRDGGEHYRLLFETARASSERLRGLIDAAPLAIMTWDRDGRVLSWNPAAERIFGWTEEEAIGSILPQIQDEARGEIMTYVERGFRGETWAGIELPRRRKDGSLVECSISSAAIRNADGEVVAVMSILGDVSERRRLERELVQAQKMEAMGRLAGGVAHDFNNMLTAIEGYASLGLTTPDLDADLRRNFVEILRAARSSADLTRQLLTFTRQQISQPAVLDLNDLLRGAEHMLERLLGEDVVVRIEPHPAVGHIRADPSQIDQLLVNLALNARAAMPTGGVLTIGTTPGTDGPDGDGTAVLRIADTGIGMDDETRTRAFEPFFTTHSTNTGLGLATVYAIVEQNRGQIRVDSEEGRGTAFTITLPAVADVAAEVATGKRDARSLEGTETILLIEDQQAVRTVARIALQRRGYHVIEAGSPSAALQLIDEEAADFDLVVTDVVLPEMNGRLLVEAIRERIPDVVALYMSGYAEDAIAHDGVLEPDVPFLVKPFTPDELARKIRALLDA